MSTTSPGPLTLAYRKAAGGKHGSRSISEEALEAVVAAAMAERLRRPFAVTMLLPAGSDAWMACEIDRIRPDGSIILRTPPEVADYYDELVDLEEAAHELSSAVDFLNEADGDVDDEIESVATSRDGLMQCFDRRYR